jgi:hypothetical protein
MFLRRGIRFDRELVFAGWPTNAHSADGLKHSFVLSTAITETAEK